MRVQVHDKCRKIVTALVEKSEKFSVMQDIDYVEKDGAYYVGITNAQLLRVRKVVEANLRADDSVWIGRRSRYVHVDRLVDALASAVSPMKDTKALRILHYTSKSIANILNADFLNASDEDEDEDEDGDEDEEEEEEELSSDAEAASDEDEQQASSNSSSRRRSARSTVAASRMKTPNKTSRPNDEIGEESDDDDDEADDDEDEESEYEVRVYAPWRRSEKRQVMTRFEDEDGEIWVSVASLERLIAENASDMELLRKKRMARFETYLQWWFKKQPPDVFEEHLKPLIKGSNKGPELFYRKKPNHVKARAVWFVNIGGFNQLLHLWKEVDRHGSDNSGKFHAILKTFEAHREFVESSIFDCTRKTIPRHLRQHNKKALAETFWFQDNQAGGESEEDSEMDSEDELNRCYDEENNVYNIDVSGYSKSKVRPPRPSEDHTNSYRVTPKSPVHSLSKERASHSPSHSTSAKNLIFGSDEEDDDDNDSGDDDDVDDEEEEVASSKGTKYKKRKSSTAIDVDRDEDSSDDDSEVTSRRNMKKKKKEKRSRSGRPSSRRKKKAKKSASRGKKQRKKRKKAKKWESSDSDSESGSSESEPSSSSESESESSSDSSDSEDASRRHKKRTKHNTRNEKEGTDGFLSRDVVNAGVSVLIGKTLLTPAQGAVVVDQLMAGSPQFVKLFKKLDTSSRKSCKKFAQALISGSLVA